MQGLDTRGLEKLMATRVTRHRRREVIRFAMVAARVLTIADIRYRPNEVHGNISNCLDVNYSATSPNEWYSTLKTQRPEVHKQVGCDTAVA